MSKKAQVTKEYEFGGVAGTTAMLFSLPLTVYILNEMCNKNICSISTLPKFSLDINDYFDWTITCIFFCWMAFVFILSLLPMGQVVEGQKLRDGSIHTFVISIASLFILFLAGVKVTYVYDHFFQLIGISVLFSVVFSCFLYAKSFNVKDGREISLGGNSGWLPYDLFMGRELNPHVYGFNVKFLCELRPGLIGWILLDLIFVIKAYEINRLSLSLICVAGFHTWYVLDSIIYEAAVLTTMDITMDGFGFMLVFGDLVWVPFLYSLTARYLLEHPVYWSNQMILAFILFNDLKTLATERGTKLLISGWWGMSRHPNYCGDLIMSLAWSLPCGFGALLPFFYPVYFIILLIHRSLRDDSHCRQKYGKDWITYCSIVPYRIIPYIF